MHLKSGSLEQLLRNQTITETLEISRRKEQIDNDNNIRRKVGYKVKRLSPSYLKTIDKLRKSMREKNDPANNSKKHTDWRIVIDKSPNKSKEVVNHGDRTNESLPSIVVSKAIEEDDNVHQSNDLNGSKVSKPLDFIEVSATASLSKKPEAILKLVTKRRVSL